MTRRDPFGEIEDLFERMDRELEKLGAGLDGARTPRVPVDVVETDEEVIVTVDLPGFDADGIAVELHDDALAIEATRTAEADPETADADSGSDAASDSGSDAASDADATDHEPAASGSDSPTYHRHERAHGSVSRRIPLPAPVEPHATTADYEVGVLTVTLPKRTPSGSGGHRIDVT